MKLSLKNINLSFSHKIVLKDLSVELQGGQVYALLGNNGAGKSTLANIICGELNPNEGTVLLDDKKIKLDSPKTARKYGIYYVHQTPMVSDYLTIEENLKIGLSKNEIKEIESYLKKWLPNVKKSAGMKNTPADVRFFTALINSLLHNPDILILDEPSALLDSTQRDFLFKNIQNLAQEGKIILVISHNFEEVIQYCDQCLYMKDGKISLKEKKELMETGTGLQKDSEGKMGTGLEESSLKLTFEKISGSATDVIPVKNGSFECIGGRVSIIKGSNEDGLLTLERILTKGDLSRISGKIHIQIPSGTKTIDLSKTPINPGILRTKLGIKVAYIPTDRKYTGSDPELTVEEILTEGEKKETEFCKNLIQKARIDIKENEKVKSLSGGMLQRLIIERELNKAPDLLILCHPMQGLAPEICNSIEERIREAAETGTAVLILTSGDFSEKNGDRSHILKAGVITR